MKHFIRRFALPTPRLVSFVLLAAGISFLNTERATAQCTITGTVNASALTCGSAPLSACNGIVYIGDGGANAGTLTMDASLNLSCLGAVQFVIRNNGTVNFTSNSVLTLATGSSFIINSGGALPQTSPCNANKEIFIGAIRIASCNGNGAAYSFAQMVGFGGSVHGTASSNSPVCTGSTINLTATPAGGSAPYTYSWGGPNSFSSTSQNPNIPGATASEAGTYTVTITDFTGLSFSSSTTVAVNPLPQGSLGGSTICVGGQGTLTLTSGGAGPFAVVYNGGAGNQTANGVVSAIPFNVTPNPIVTTPYNLVSVTDANGCTRSSGFTVGTASITVNSDPAIFTVSGGGTICPPATATVNLDGSEIGINYQLYVTIPGPFTAPVGSPVAGTGSPLSFTNLSLGGDYTVVATGPSAGCSATMSGMATVAPDFSLIVDAPMTASCGEEITITVKSGVCDAFEFVGLQFSMQWDPSQFEFVSGSESEFTLLGSSIGVTASTLGYSWSGGPESFTGGSTMLTFKLKVKASTGSGVVDLLSLIPADLEATQSNFYIISIPAANKTINFTPNATLLATITATESSDIPDDDILCPGSSAQLTAGATGGSAPYTYAWNPNIGAGAGPHSVTPPNGLNTYTVTVTDDSGCTTTDTHDLTVEDVTDPATENCPGNITTTSSTGDDAVTGDCGAQVNYTAVTFQDNCDGTGLTGVLSAGQASGTIFPVGTTTVTYTYDDNAPGNTTAVCTFTVEVTDDEAPVISGCPTDINIGTDPGVCTAVATWTPPTANDNCDGAITPTGSHTPGATFSSGTTTVTYTATDAGGNPATSCTFNVIVTDDEAPVISGCPTDINIGTDPGVCTAVATWTPPTANDNCDGAITPTGSHTSGSTFSSGTTTVTYTATDAGGNPATSCSFNVIVTDDEAPVISGCPTDINIGTDPGVCTAVATWTPPTANDNCDGAITPTGSHTPGSTFSSGTTTVTYTAIDAGGNPATSCTFNVIVTDDEAPSVTCPEPVIVFADLDCDFDVTNTDFDVTLADTEDNCGVVLIVNNLNGLSSLSGEALLQDSTYVITWTVTDGGGLTAFCTATITVSDTTGPLLSYSFPTSYTANVTSGDCSAVITIERPNITSACPIPIPGFDNFTVNECDLAYIQPVEGPAVVNGLPDPDFLDVVPPVNVCDPLTKFAAIQFPVGTTEIPYVWCDSLGNCDTVVITVTVLENGLPVAKCVPGPVTLSLDASGVAVVTTDLVNASSGDNCGIDSSWVLPDTLRCINAGNNLVVLTIRDEDGNTDTCQTTVNVVDNLPPVVNCPTDFVASTDNNSCSAMASGIPGLVLTELPSDSSITGPGQYLDNCGVTNITYSLSGATTGSGTYPIPGSQVFNGGATTVSYTFEDAEGNTVSCSFIVTVKDLVPPTAGITCPNPPPVNANQGGCIAIVNWIPPVFTDNCPGIIIVTSSHNPGAFFFFDTTLVTYTAIDASGNVGICTFNIVVNDVQPPVAKCKNINATLDANSGVVTVNPFQLDNGSTDNCFYNYVNQPVVYNCTNAGANDYTLVIEDAGGNRDSATCTVTVMDITAPSILNCGAFTPAAINLDVNCLATLDAGVYAQNFIITDNTLNSSPSCPLTYEVDVDGSGFAASYQFTCADKGNKVVTFRVSDVFGNSALCTKTITVNDVTPPSILDANTIAPPSVTVECSDYDPNDFATLGEITTADVTDACDDACDATITIAFNDVTAPGACDNAFSVTRTWTVTDAAGNTAQHTQTFSVEDTTPPVISGVQTLINLEANNQNETPPCAVPHTVELFAFNVSDNCTTDFSDYSISYLIDFAPLGVGSNSSGTGAVAASVFPIGTSEVTFTVEDSCGNTSQVMITVVVDDVDGPLANEPFASFFGNTQSVCGQTFSILNATDNCGNNFTWYRPYKNINEENFLDCSTYSVTETISDPTVQSAINVSAPFVYNNPPLFSIHPTTFFPVGQTVISYTATDGAGNTSTCSFVVEILDNQAPTINCPANQNLPISSACVNATLVPNYLNGVQVTDNCPNNVVLSQSPAAGSLLSDVVNPVQAGQTFTVTVTAKDSFPNSLPAVPCTFTVALFDDEAPVPVLPFLPNIITFCGQDTVDAPAALDCNGTDYDTIYGTPSVPVQGFLPPLVPGGPPRYILNPGNYAITWSYTDPQNNTTAQLQDVQVLPDNTPPMAICKPPFSVNLSAAGDYALALQEIDNGSNDPAGCGPVTLTINPSVLTCSNLSAPVNVVLSVKDVGGNTAQCSTVVTVLDVTAPVLSPIPANITLEACVPIPPPADITAADICDANVAITYVQDTTVLTNAYTYTIRRTWKATDDSGNMSTGTQIIVIQDTKAPVFAGAPTVITVFTDANNLNCKDTVAFDITPFIDECDSTTLMVTNNRTAQGANYSEILDLGVYTLVFTAKDGNNNSASHTITVEVKDGTDPIAACINGVSVSLQASGTVIITPANINANSSDNCTPQNLLDLKIQRLDPAGPLATSITFTCADADGVTQHPVKLYVKDQAGNEATCETYIVVQDNVAPLIICPQGKILQCNADFSPGIQGIALATDNCTVTSMTYTDSTAIGSGNVCYQVLRTWTAVDQAGNQAKCVQVFNVQDTVKPVLTNLPANISISCSDVLVAPPSVSATDNCTDTVDVVLVVDTIDAGQGNCGMFSYTIRRTWTATDDCGNSNVHTQLVNVTDSTDPVFDGMPDTLVISSADYPPNANCLVPLALNAGQYLTDCAADSLLTVTNNAAHGDGALDISGDYTVGIYNIQFAATDPCGNEGLDSIILIVRDNSVPTIVCNDNIIIALGTNGEAMLSPGDIDLGSNDNCGIDTMYLSQSSFDCSDLGINAVTLTIIDNSGNTNTCTVDVEVTPGVNIGFTLTTSSTPESVSGANDGTATATASGGSGQFSYEWNNSDTTASITGLPAGTYIVTATDAVTGCQQVDTVVVDEGLKIGIAVGIGEACIGQTVSIPVTAENFADVTSFNFTLHVTGDTVGTILGITSGSIHPGLTGGFSSNLLPGNNLGVFWLDTALTLPNGAVLFSIDIQLGTAAIGSISPVIITGTPVSLSFMQLINGNNVSVNVDTLNGLIEIACGVPDLQIGGDIQTWNNPVPVPGVDVSLSGTVNASQTTGLPGTYLFGIPDSANTIVKCSKVTAGNSGITGADILLIKRHALNIQQLTSPYQFVAADVSGEGNLSILDYSRIQQVALALQDHITGSPDWKFVPKSYIFPTPPLSSPVPDSISHLPAATSFLDDDFVAVRMGDVNGNVVPSFSNDQADDRSGTFRFELEERSYKQGEMIEIPFRASGFNAHSGYQMTLHFDPTVLEWKGFAPGVLPDMSDANYGAMRVQEGTLTTLWVTPEPMTIPDGETLFVLKFKVLRSGSTLSEVLRVGSDVTRAEGYDSQGNAMNIDLTFVEKQSGAVLPVFALYQNQPNPFSETTSIAFRLPESGHAALRVFNASGQLMKTVEGDFNKGYHEVRFQRNELGAPGVYYYELENAGNSDRKKMILKE